MRLPKLLHPTHRIEIRKCTGIVMKRWKKRSELWLLSRYVTTPDEEDRMADHRRRHAEESVVVVAMKLDLAPLPSTSMPPLGPETVILPTKSLQQTKINVSKAVFKVRGHTSCLQLRCGLFLGIGPRQVWEISKREAGNGDFGYVCARQRKSCCCYNVVLE